MLNAVTAEFRRWLFQDVTVTDGATDGVVLAISQPGVIEGRSVRTTEGHAFTGVVADVRGVRPNAEPGDFQAIDRSGATARNPPAR